MTDAVHLFALAERQRDWLAARQAAIAGNVANAATPGYRARDVAPFAAAWARAEAGLAVTHAAHLRPADQAPGAAATVPAEAWEVSHSGNSVRLDQEMLRAGEVHRAMALNAAVVRAFHRMSLHGLRSP